MGAVIGDTRISPLREEKQNELGHYTIRQVTRNNFKILLSVIFPPSWGKWLFSINYFCCISC